VWYSGWYSTVHWVVQLVDGTEISLTYDSRHEIDSRSNDVSIHSCAGLAFYLVYFIGSIHKLVVLIKKRIFNNYWGY